MSREEVSALGSARREEVRRQIENSERLKANPLLYLVSPQVKVIFIFISIYYFSILFHQVPGNNSVGHYIFFCFRCLLFHLLFILLLNGNNGIYFFISFAVKLKQKMIYDGAFYCPKCYTQQTLF